MTAKRTSTPATPATPPKPAKPAKPPKPASSEDTRVAREEGERQLTDAKSMRAMAHPTRLALLEAIFREGPLTATEAANLLDDSPGNISWHLGILARYGYIEEVSAKGRRRPWRLVSPGARFSSTDQDSPELSAAASALAATGLEQSWARLQDWLAHWHLFPGAWRSAGFTAVAIAYLTPAELDEVSEKVGALLQRYRDRSVDRTLRPEGSAPVQLVAWGHPLPPLPGEK